MTLSYDAIRAVLRCYRLPAMTSTPMRAHLRFREIRRAQPGSADVDIMRALVDEGLVQFAVDQPDAAEILRLRYVDGLTADTVMARQSLSSSEFHRRQRTAIEGLAAVMQAQETAAREAFAQSELGHLGPPDYSRLFGFDRHLETLANLLATDADPAIGLAPVVGIYGIGGLGKTTLADRFLRSAIEDVRFERFAFVSARPFGFRIRIANETTPTHPLTTSETIVEKLARRLLGDERIPVPFDLATTVRLLAEEVHNREHLIVLDNLETVADLDRLLAIVTHWVDAEKAHGSRFILTSRHQAAPDHGIYPFHVPVLSRDDALQLVRYRAGRSGMHAVEAADDATLAPIYETVGGNPLALLLVTGQLRNRPLPAVLATLRERRGQFAESMYAHLFEHSLAQLDAQAMNVLTLMPLMPAQGASYAMLQALTELDNGVLGDALRHLVAMNLVTHSLSPALNESRYTIHTLTATYLAEQMQSEADQP